MYEDPDNNAEVSIDRHGRDRAGGVSETKGIQRILRQGKSSERGMMDGMPDETRGR